MKFLAILVFTFSMTTFGEPIDEQQVQNAVQRMLGEKGVADLLKFKEIVESEAHATTLLLCRGYRQFSGRDPHPHTGMPSLALSLAAWGRIAKEGLVQPFSAMGGNKSTAIVSRPSAG